MNSTARPFVLRACRAGAVAGVALLLAIATCPAADARPDPGDLASTAGPTELTYELRRIGTQLVRGDLLTGADVTAPAFIGVWGPDPQQPISAEDAG